MPISFVRYLPNLHYHVLVRANGSRCKQTRLGASKENILRILQNLLALKPFLLACCVAKMVAPTMELDVIRNLLPRHLAGKIVDIWAGAKSEHGLVQKDNLVINVSIL